MVVLNSGVSYPSSCLVKRRCQPHAKQTYSSRQIDNEEVEGFLVSSILSCRPPPLPSAVFLSPPSSCQRLPFANSTQLIISTSPFHIGAQALLPRPRIAVAVSDSPSLHKHYASNQVIRHRCGNDLGLRATTGFGWTSSLTGALDC